MKVQREVLSLDRQKNIEGEMYMKWKKFTLETTTDAVDYLGSMFDDIGIEGMEIEDNVPLTESVSGMQRRTNGI